MNTLIEKWSKSQRRKRRKNCANPKGFTMKQFCKNQKSKSKKGQKLNEDMQSFNSDMEIVKKALQDISEYEVINKLVIKMSSDQVREALSKYIEEEIQAFLDEKRKKKKKKLDRCARIAKRKYKVWPSAYASGAAVKCRQGKIWKNEK